jgi:lysophospholipase L1-like esterase
MLKPHTLFCAGALALASAAQAAETLPDFLSKVQLHNFDGYELTPDGKGASVYRLPAEVREHLSEAGARIMAFSQSGEIRFVLKEGAKLEDVTIHLKSNRNTSISFYRGDELCGRTTLIAKKGVEPYTPPSLVGKTSTKQYPDKACEIDLIPAKLKLPAKAAEGVEGPKPAKRFPEQLCRVVLNGGVITLTGIEGDIRPPKPEELPPVLVSYGTSISMGAAASKPDLQFTALTAAALGFSLRNLGCSGSAFCEIEMADYLVQQPGDLFLFEISVNMVGKDYTVDEFRKRATYLVDAVAKAHPKAPVVCISILPFGADKVEKTAVRPREFRKALEEVCRATPHKNVHFVDGTQLLSFEGLAKDNIHPTDAGHAEIASKLVPQIEAFLGKKGQ